MFKLKRRDDGVFSDDASGYEASNDEDDRSVRLLFLPINPPNRTLIMPAAGL